MPLSYRDLRDEAERCICGLPAPAVEQLLTRLDDVFLEWAARQHADRDSSDD